MLLPHFRHIIKMTVYIIVFVVITSPSSVRKQSGPYPVFEMSSVGTIKGSILESKGGVYSRTRK